MRLCWMDTVSITSTWDAKGPSGCDLTPRFMFMYTPGGTLVSQYLKENLISHMLAELHKLPVAEDDDSKVGTPAGGRSPSFPSP